MSSLETYPTSLYLDLELNCHDVAKPGQPAPEIIEIGIVSLNVANLSTVREANYLVRPQRLTVTKRCTLLTGIDSSHVRNALSFRDVIWSITAEWPGNPISIAWGNDGEILAHACRAHLIKTPFRRSIDLSHIVQHALALRNQPSLRAALELFGLSSDGAHRALVDARNTARVHAALIRSIRSVTRSEANNSEHLITEQQTPFGAALTKGLKAIRGPVGVSATALHGHQPGADHSNDSYK